MLTDERRLEREVHQWEKSGGEPTEYRRPRRWPNGSETLSGGRVLTDRTRQ